jgi:hypothetical protein
LTQRKSPKFLSNTKLIYAKIEEIYDGYTELNNLVETWYNEIDDICNNLMNKNERDKIFFT